MNNLITEAGRILDLDPHLYKSTIISEADHKEKLRNTYMFVNGTLRYVSKFRWEDNGIDIYDLTKDSITTVDVETLEPWLPLSGMYVTDKFAVHLVKKAHKHWRKSFYADNYVLNFITILSSSVEKILYTTMATLQPEKMAVVKNHIYLEGKSIGKIDKNGVVILSNPLFYQEVLDFSNKKELNWLIQ